MIIIACAGAYPAPIFAAAQVKVPWHGHVLGSGCASGGTGGGARNTLVWHPSPASHRKTFLLEIHFKKLLERKKKKKKRENNHKQHQESFSESLFKKKIKREKGKKKEAFFFLFFFLPRPKCC